jgi:hypothetical protein
MFFQKSFLLSLNLLFLPFAVLHLSGILFLLSFLLQSKSKQSFLPQSLYFSLVLLLFHSSLLLGELLQLVLFCKLFRHVSSELCLQTLLLFFLLTFSLFCVTLSANHFQSLPLSFFGLLLLFPSHLGLILLLVKLPPQTI